LLACQAITAALVIGPNLPSAEIPKWVCKQETSVPTEPTLKVELIEQSRAAALSTFTAAKPTTMNATTKTPKRNFDFNKLLIYFSNFYAIN
jgi:hypothetical protein